MPDAARVTDGHECPMANPDGSPHEGGPILSGSDDVDINDLPAARVTDEAQCTGPVDHILDGSSTVDINDLPAARVGDPTEHGGCISEGSEDVTIGD